MSRAYTIIGGGLAGALLAALLARRGHQVDDVGIDRGRDVDLAHGVHHVAHFSCIGHGSEGFEGLVGAVRLEHADLGRAIGVSHVDARHEAIALGLR